MLGQPSAVDAPNVPALAAPAPTPRRATIQWRRLSPRIWIGLSVVGLMIFLAVTADFLTPYDPNYQDYSAFRQPPSLDHLFGTDQVGRDVYSRVIYGTRISLLVGVIAVGIGMTAGVLIGLVAGLYRGWMDETLMRIMDAIHAFPALVLALAITAALGTGIVNIMIAIGIVYMPSYARLVRGQVLSVRERDFVVAAQLLGASMPRLMFFHIWPNVTAPIIVQASLNVSTAILTEASLSFLGLGVRPPTPSWGSSLQGGYQYLSTAPWLSIYPGIAIFIAVLAFNLFGDGLRQLLDPRLRARGEA
ncbi:MAG TPA: ABC transporter permease [Chloroflexota bacterium]|nr:ABC transporter permease [Chloroflexota bacterium]